MITIRLVLHLRGQFGEKSFRNCQSRDTKVHYTQDASGKSSNTILTKNNRNRTVIDVIETK